MFDFKIIFRYTAPLLFIYAAADIMYKTAGYHASSLEKLSIIAFYAAVSSYRLSFYLIGLPVTLLYAAYTPIGYTFGAPTYQYIASIFSTNANEISEFASIIPLKSWIYSLIIAGCVSIFWLLVRKKKISYIRNKCILALCVTLLYFINPSPYLLLETALSSSGQVKAEMEALEKMSDFNDSWGKSRVLPDGYDDYVLIIGESERRDYMHKYGYAIPNTPFIDKTPGKVVDGLLSAGSNTVASLRLMLTLPEDGKPRYPLNVIDLARSADIYTYWISNQGYIGEHDSPVTAIANRADNMFFLKSGAYNSKPTSDYQLLPILKAKVGNEAKGKRLFVVHLYGSHINVCNRVKDFDGFSVIKDEYKYISCYVSSIKKTDSVVKKIYDTMKESQEQSGRTFSMVYFSDHGQIHHKDNKEIRLRHGDTAYAYSVPLIKISSDDTKQFNIKAKKCGVNFVNGLGTWMGIKNDHLMHYDLFSEQSDSATCIGSKAPELEDSAINIEPYLSK
ncbi:MAG: phosphoethanolamine transferase [Gammaproteobacteria bacterium]|nr:phosphoethanolamine transferase [Gammaproteobacteria bacterium]